MLCPKCGKELPDDAVFCTACGYNLSKRELVSPGANANTQKGFNLNDMVQKGTLTNGFDPGAFIQKNKKALIIAAAILVLLFVAKGFFGRTASTGGFDSAEAAVDGYLNAMMQQDEEAFVNCFPKELRDKVSTGLEREKNIGPSDEYSAYRFIKVYSYEGFAFPVDEYTELSKDELNSYNEKYGYHAKNGETAKVWVEFHSRIILGGEVFSEGTEQRPAMDLSVGKIGGKWFVLEPPEVWCWHYLLDY